MPDPTTLDPAADKSLEAQALKAVKKPSQPASRIYAVDGGWRVQAYVWKNLFIRTHRSAMPWFIGRKNRWIRGFVWWFKDPRGWKIFKFWSYCIGVGVGLGGVSQYISATIVATAFAGLLTALLTVWTLLSLLFIGILTAGNYIYSSIYRLSYRCPFCFESMTIPVFICSNQACGTRHTRLWPSLYGVFHHKCIHEVGPVGPDGKPQLCGTKLPTLNFLGRSKLERHCPHCDMELNKTIGVAAPVHIAVAGGTNAGKTYLLVTATRDLIQNYARANGRDYTITFPSDEDRLNYEDNLTRLTPGHRLDQTLKRPNAYNLDIHAPHSALAKRFLPRASLSRLAYVYDVMGESFRTSAEMSVQKFYSYINALIFVIDPFAIPDFADKHRDEIRQLGDALSASKADIQQSYERMRELLEVSAKLKANERTNRPLAVVVTKVDALGLENVIGAPAAQKLMVDDPSICLEEDAISLLVRSFLIENGESNLVASMESRFNNIRYFSCSALGGMLGSAPETGYVSIRSVDPLVWTLGFSHGVDAISERKALADAQHRAQGKALGGLRSLRYYYWNSLRPQSLERGI